MAHRPSVSLVLPVLNGAAFIERSVRDAMRWVREHEHRLELIVVNDGSRDATAAILERMKRELSGGPTPLRVLTNPVNRGKGYSVRRGLLEASGELRVFTDADLTYTMGSLVGIVDALIGGADIAVGCRVHERSEYVVAPSFFRYIYTRHNAGRVFNALVRAALVRDLRDTQAGLKGFRADVVRDLFPRLEKDRFSFDVELLFLAQKEGYRIVEVPVTYLYRKEPSTVSFVKDTVDMCVDLASIRWAWTRGRYDRAVEAPRSAAGEREVTEADGTA